MYFYHSLQWPVEKNSEYQVILFQKLPYISTAVNTLKLASTYIMMGINMCVTRWTILVYLHRFLHCTHHHSILLKCPGNTAILAVIYWDENFWVIGILSTTFQYMCTLFPELVRSLWLKVPLYSDPTHYCNNFYAKYALWDII